MNLLEKYPIRLERQYELTHVPTVFGIRMRSSGIDQDSMREWFVPVSSCSPGHLTSTDHYKQLTVQTFNSCTSQPDVFHCLVVKTQHVKKYKPCTSMTHVANEPKLRSIVRSSMHPCQEKIGGNRVSGRVLCPDCPRI